MKKLTLACVILVGALNMYAQPQLEDTSMTYEDSLWMVIEQKALNLEYQSGSIEIGEGLAMLHLPEGFKYLDPENSEFVLTTVWGNPPGGQTLGMLFMEDATPVDSTSAYAVNISYDKEGHVKDDDAGDIDYDELLETMREDIESGNAYRKENGYPTLELVGWASPPFYDMGSKKLHWAKELHFEGMTENTLNYNIRALGREGVLVLNVIGDMNALDEVKKDVDKILASVEFTEGNRYADFDPSIDEVAAYGIGGLIAGKVLAKAGILAKLGIFLAKGWKIIALALVGAVAVIRKFFIGKKKADNQA